MLPLIITACDPTVNPLVSDGGEQTEEERQRTIDETVREICDARDAGAAISHHHGIYTYSKEQGYKVDRDGTNETVLGVRAKCDVIVQMGGAIGAMTTSEEGQKGLEQMWARARLDQVSTITNRMEFAALGLARTETRDGLERSLRFCLEQGVQPEFEVWQVGDTWNMKQALEHVGMKPPYWVELLHAGDGAAWSPATLEETLHRAAYLPEGSVWHANAYTAPKGQLTPEEHTRFLTQIITVGGNVRIGKEDRPDAATGQPARTNAELVEMVAWISRKLGREVATPDQAREMLGLDGS